jgi:small subunit ribosomal protein S6
MTDGSLRKYETVYILKPSLGEKGLEQIHKKIDSVILKFKGKLQGRDDWGVKELAYEINRERSGRIVVIQFSGSPGVVEEIERHFKITEDVLRYLTVSVDKDYDYQKMKKQMAMFEEDFKRGKEMRDRRRSKGAEAG